MESFGQLLRVTRESQGIDINKAERETSISKEYITALEEENVSLFPGEPYLVGFLRNYSEYLGLDAKYLISQGEYKDAQRKLRRAANIDTENNQEVLNLLFYTCYKLVKDDICEYNVKEAINIANKIEDFNYPEYKEELENKLKNM